MTQCMPGMMGVTRMAGAACHSHGRVLPVILFFVLFFYLVMSVSVARAADFPPPPVMLANIYRSDTPLADYLVSEKLDGVRGYWDGEKLLTRGGERIVAPGWFTAGWPDFPLDGELWVGRGQFASAVSIVRLKTPDDAAWRTLRFMVFDLPAHPGGPSLSVTRR